MIITTTKWTAFYQIFFGIIKSNNFQFLMIQCFLFQCFCCGFADIVHTTKYEHKRWTTNNRLLDCIMCRRSAIIWERIWKFSNWCLSSNIDGSLQPFIPFYFDMRLFLINPSNAIIRPNHNIVCFITSKSDTTVDRELVKRDVDTCFGVC